MNLYFISILISFVSVVIWMIALETDKKRNGIAEKLESTTGQKIAAVVKLSILLCIPAINVLIAILAWFKYDEVIKEALSKKVNA